MPRGRATAAGHGGLLYLVPAGCGRLPAVGNKGRIHLGQGWLGIQPPNPLATALPRTSFPYLPCPAVPYSLLYLIYLVLLFTLPPIPACKTHIKCLAHDVKHAVGRHPGGGKGQNRRQQDLAAAAVVRHLCNGLRVIIAGSRIGRYGPLPRPAISVINPSYPSYS